MAKPMVFRAGVRARKLFPCIRYAIDMTRVLWLCLEETRLGPAWIDWTPDYIARNNFRRPFERYDETIMWLCL
jgi:hypothetical protein